MDTFQFSRPTTVDQAVQAGAKSSTAQQSAEVRFVAGGTTLVDLMKLLGQLALVGCMSDGGEHKQDGYGA